MKELIEKYKTMSETLLDVINHPKTDEAELQKAMACRRFVVGFLSDIVNISKQSTT